MSDKQFWRHGLPAFLSIFLVPAIFLLHNLNFFRELLFYDKVLALAFVYLAFPPLLYGIARKLLRLSKDLTALVVLLLSVLFFFFGALQDLLVAHAPTRFLSKTYILPLPILMACFYLVVKRPAVKKYHSTFSLVLLLFLLSECGVLLFNLPHFSRVPPSKDKVRLSASVQGRNAFHFNVYHLIFDGYTSSSALKHLFHYSNPIDSFLTKQGFYVTRRTKANYNFTPYSLAATLNLGYLSLEQQQLPRDFRNYLFGAKAYQQNKIFPFFRKLGYEVRSFSLLDNYSYLDQFGTFVPKSPFLSLRNQTLERIFLNPWLWHKLSSQKQQSLPPLIKENLQSFKQYQDQALAHVLRAPSFNKRRYSLTHFFLPHEPYVFTGTSIDSLRLDDLLDHEQGYIKQIEYANSVIVKVVAELKKENHNIIIIQGDHGFREYDFSRDPRHLQFEALNAIYFPDGNYRVLYDSISPVNTYRVILSQYFLQDLPLLKDEQIVPEE